MKRFTQLLVAACIIAAGPVLSRAQHFDMLAQQVDGRIVTGAADFDGGQWSLGRRVFFRDFDSDFAINNPGFNALGSSSPSLPAGSQALPGNAPLEWDFLPMTIGSASQNLFYWNGLESDGLPGLTSADVAFGPLPGPNYLLSLFDKSNAKYSVDGADAIVSGGVIDDTAADGSIHRHRFWFLEDGDGNGGTSPADGIYLLAMRLRMVGLVDSLPVLFVFGTPGSSAAALDDAAVPWVEAQLDLSGDYNQNGAVDSADYTLWRDSLTQTGTALAADGNGNQAVDLPDYDLWKQHFGEAAELRFDEAIAAGSVVGTPATGVPEPAAVTTMTAISVPWIIRRARRARRGPGSARPRC